MGSVAAILLAAGESSRMGQLKALLPWQGRTLLQHQLCSLASAGVSRIVVVLGHRHQDLAPLLEGHLVVEWVHNPDYQQGKTTSLKAGLGALGQSGEEVLLILNVDQPRTPHTIARLLAEHRASGQLITIPCYHGKGGHPVLISTRLLGELMHISEETQGMKAVVRRHEGETRRLEMDAPEVLLDLNTPGEYERAVQSPKGDPEPNHR